MNKEDVRFTSPNQLISQVHRVSIDVTGISVDEDSQIMSVSVAVDLSSASLG